MLCSSVMRQAPPISAAQWQQQRGLQLLDLFSKENRAKRKKRLQEDLQRGYFDDFKELKDTQGKLWRAPDRLIPAEAARSFPPIKVVRPDKVAIEFPHAPEKAPAASLVCVGFKDGSEDMLASWSDPFAEAFQERGDAGLVELSVVESQVMALWPFRNMILAAPRRAAKEAAAAEHDPLSAASPTDRAVAAAEGSGSPAGASAAAGGGSTSAGGSKSSDTAGTAAGSQSSGPAGSSSGGVSNSTNGGTPSSEAGAAPVDTGSPPVLRGRRRGRLHTEYLFFFGDAYDLCHALQITNRLTGYAFLLDRKGRTRFRGCGSAQPGERDTLIAATQQLLDAG